MNRRILIAFVLLPGCGGARPATETAGASPSSSGPVEALSAFAARRVMVLPAQSLRPSDALGWAATVGDSRTFLAQVDSALERGFRNAGLAPAWTMASDLARTAQRNPVSVTAPGDIRAADAVRALERKRDEDIPEPVASQLRTFASFNDARYALVPVDVRFERGEFADAGRAILRVGILDVRGSKLVFIGDIVGLDAGDYPTAILNLGRRFADLIAPH